MTTNILITGGLGYIGSHTALDLLLNTDDHIVIVDNCSNSDLSTLQRIQNVSKGNVSFHEASVGDYDLIMKILKLENIDAVIHFGAAKSVSDSLQDPGFYYENNVSSLMTLINAAQCCNVKHFIFSSSATVYNSTNHFPVDEDDRLGYINPYGQTKLIGEDILLREHQQSDLNVGILRYFNPIGNESTGQLGDRLTSSTTNIMPMLYRALQQNKPFFIFGDDYPTYDGTPVRDYIHINDLASAHRSMLDHLLKVSGIHTFNVGLGKGVSVLDLVNTFNSVNNLSIQINYQERRAGDLPVCFANTNKIQTHLGWHAKYNLDDMCRDAFTFFKKNYL
jgi:UDP-glucose 4-epimerase